jgi:uncharacterized membrane protein
MRNRIVGVLIIGIAVLIGFIIFSFNQAMTNIVNTSCSHGTSCPMWGTIEFQTNMSIGIMIFIIGIGVYLIFFGTEEKIITRLRLIKQQIEPKRITKENYKKVIGTLSSEEKTVFNKVIEAQGSMSQSVLMKETNFNKVKITRILDRLEGKGLIERRRRGMTNIVVLKQ